MNGHSLSRARWRSRLAVSLARLRDEACSRPTSTPASITTTQNVVALNDALVQVNDTLIDNAIAQAKLLAPYQCALRAGGGDPQRLERLGEGQRLSRQECRRQRVERGGEGHLRRSRLSDYRHRRVVGERDASRSD